MKARSSAPRSTPTSLRWTPKTGKELWRSHVIDFKDGYSDDRRAAGRRRRRDDRHIGRRVRHPRLHRRLGPGRPANICGAPTPLPVPTNRTATPGPAIPVSIGGGSTWITGSFDPELHTVYWGIGNPGPFNAARAPGRQPLHLLGSGARSQDRQDQVALSSSRRTIRSTMTASPRWCLPTIDIKRQADQGADGRQPQRFHLCARSHRRQADRRQPLRHQVNWASGIDMTTGRPVETEVTTKARPGEESRRLAVDPRRQELGAGARSTRRPAWPTPTR